MARLGQPRDRSGGRRGVTTVEAALVLPFVVLLLMGLLEYGWMFLKVQQLGSAARHGVRVGVREGATNADVQAAVDLLMAGAGLDASGYVTTLVPSDTSLIPVGGTLTVNVTVPYSNIGLLNILLIPVPDNLEGETVMAKEGAIPIP